MRTGRPCVPPAAGALHAVVGAPWRGAARRQGGAAASRRARHPRRGRARLQRSAPASSVRDRGVTDAKACRPRRSQTGGGPCPCGRRVGEGRKLVSTGTAAAQTAACGASRKTPPPPAHQVSHRQWQVGSACKHTRQSRRLQPPCMESAGPGFDMPSGPRLPAALQFPSLPPSPGAPACPWCPSRSHAGRDRVLAVHGAALHVEGLHLDIVRARAQRRARGVGLAGGAGRKLAAARGGANGVGEGEGWQQGRSAEGRGCACRCARSAASGANGQACRAQVCRRGSGRTLRACSPACPVFPSCTHAFSQTQPSATRSLPRPK